MQLSRNGMLQRKGLWLTQRGKWPKSGKWSQCGMAILVNLCWVSMAHATLFSSLLPTSRAVQVGQTASLFATVITDSSAELLNCRIALASAIDATFTYQTTNPATNEPTGTVNTPVNIAAGGSQSFVLTLTPNSAISSTEVEFEFRCDNDGPAGVVSGLNTLQFSATTDPIPDIIALSATVGGLGIADLPQDNGLGFFTVATNNIGASGTLDVIAAVGANSTPAEQILVCQTDLAGACVVPPATAQITVQINAGATPTFAVFLSNTDEVVFDPGNNRVFLTFLQNGEARGSTSVAFRGGGRSARGVFDASVSPNTVQGRCVGCHTNGGIAANTRLIFQVGADDNTRQNNFDVFETFISVVPNGVSRILSKAQGALAHGGGVQVSAGTPEFNDLSLFLELLSGEATGSVNPGNLFASTSMLSTRRTLRNAALLVAGRLPTQEEEDAVASGDENGLRTTLRGLMQGPGFHAFLLEGANDRLLTDRQLYNGITIDNQEPYFVRYSEGSYSLRLAAQGTDDNSPENQAAADYNNAANYGFARAPLELIAYVVEQDRPYTEVLTANYVMANPLANHAYGGDAQFNDPDDQGEFQPTQILAHYRHDGSQDTEFFEGIGLLIRDRGNLLTQDYPHAGVLTTNAFLQRYPSTATNRNRARARWTYYHFLGFDIEKSAARTQDPEDLADKNNPTLNNPVCTSCHEVMDPVAGAFQNFGDTGNFRDQYGGLDSLDHFYKYEDGSPYQNGDTWYADMRMPGFGAQVVPDAGNSLEWLAQRIVEDPRFATAAVRFWWPAVMGTEALEAPENDQDLDFQANLLAFTAQNQFIEDLGSGFREGFHGGAPYNLKDLLVEMLMSPWYRADAETSDDPLRRAAKASAGAERLLTPEQLNRKTLAVTGLQWGGFEEFWRGYPATSARLLADFNLYFGGINSAGVIKRTEIPNAVMASVAQAHAVRLSCPLVMREMILLPDGERKLFNGIDRDTTPTLAGTGSTIVDAASSSASNLFSVDANVGGPVRVTVRFTNDFYDDVTQADRNLHVDRLTIRNQVGQHVETIEYENLANRAGFAAECGDRGWNPETGQEDHFNIWSECNVAFQWTPPVAGNYSFQWTVWGQQAGPEAVNMSAYLDTLDPQNDSQGSRLIRQKLAELSFTLLGEERGVDHPEVERLYQLLVASWQAKRNAAEPHYHFPGNVNCDWGGTANFFDGVVDDPFYVHPMYRYQSFDWERLEDVLNGYDYQDPQQMLQVWPLIVATLLSDYKYLYY